MTSAAQTLAGQQTDAPASDDALAIDSVVCGHFIIRSKLGGGGMGEVYLAENLNLPGMHYAVKVLRPLYAENAAFIDMLRAEAMRQAQLVHDNVVGIYDLLFWGGSCFVIQSFAPGETLAAMIDETPAGLPLIPSLALMQGMLSGLNYANEHGILHCDVKPANVIVDTDGRPRVTDFGIARDAGSVLGDSRTIGAGTPAYMSPEQILTPLDIDHRSDVFSAGVLMFEMLTRTLPFGDADDDADGAQGLRQTFEDAPDIRRVQPDVPQAIARIVATALQRDRTQRFQSCAEFKQAIDRYLWRRRWLPVIVSVGVVALLIGGVLTKLRYDERREALAAAEENRHRAALISAEAVMNASTVHGLLCREWIDYQLRFQGIQKARDANLLDLVPRFEAKLAEMQVNMDDHVANYGKALNQLRSVEAPVVSRAVADMSASSESVHAFGSYLLADDAALRKGQPLPAQAALLKRCPKPVS